MFFDEFLSFLFKWFRSRNWKSLLWLAGGICLLPALALFPISYGFSIPSSQLATQCLEATGSGFSDLPIELENSGPENSESNPNASLQVPLRRILQIGSFNERVVYVVASQLARQGRLAMAAKLMRDVAPVNDVGFAEAHRWLGSYALAQPKDAPLDRLALKHDLKIAVESASTITAAHVAAYAKMLDLESKTEDAAKLVRARKTEFPELRLLHAELALKLGDSMEFREAIRDAREYVEQKFDDGTADPNDVIRLVQLALLEEDIDRALGIAQAAVKKLPQEPVLRLLYSEVLCLKYKELEDNPKGTTLGERLRYLDMALRIAPSNQMVIGEVAKAMQAGSTVTPELKAALEQSLADGNAPTMVHMIIANGKLASGEPEAAIPHLERALKDAPDSGIIKNNLALAIMNSRPAELDKAEELIKSALTSPGLNAGFAASMLDTQGQIREKQRDAIGAMESYEKAIQLDGQKINTRERLVRLYNAAGMQDLAAAQQRRLTELKAQASEQKDEPN